MKYDLIFLEDVTKLYERNEDMTFGKSFYLKSLPKQNISRNFEL